MKPAARFAFLALLAPLSAGAVSLSKADVAPRVFTPNGDGINDIVYFNLANPSLDSVEGKIYDADGSQVADLVNAPAGAVSPAGSLGPDALMWDGRDRNGNTVRAGVYIYVVRGGGQSITGTVVVAK